MAKNEYNHKNIEKKWQEKWEKEGIYKAKDNSKKDYFYSLIEFPYPSGEGLHVGHLRSNTAMDIISRKRRMEGKNVLYPIGWDAFGLPAENYAIKTGIHPEIATSKNINNFTKQLKALGFSFDWSREISTIDPKYYKWTQWMFIQFFKHNLAYKAKIPINWCLSCKIGLANEEVVDGKCERCGGEVEKRHKEQWMIKITKYADRLIDDLEKVDYLPRIKEQQINWIGKSEGAEVDFEVKNTESKIKVFTTRPDTLFGATYMVLAPEHELIGKLKSSIENWAEVEKYINDSNKKSDLERTELQKEKTGVELKGVKVINPVNNEEIPVWIADYVLTGYGTGAIMAVPAHDERDWEFAKKFDLPIREVISGGDVGKEAFTEIEKGKVVNSDFLNGLKPDEAIEKMNDWLEKEKLGKKTVNYKLRDWVFSRQRYWGEPIPLVHCEKCGWVAVPDNELPVELPKIEKYEPTDSGESPLANISDWINVKCPTCGEKARRETDTMPNWAGSSWYFLRYVDSNNDKEFASEEALKQFMPVDWYNGGMEHTTLHLLYSRFWYKFLFDIGVIPKECGDEPYKKRTSHGMILGESGEKMSKSRGNVINPDEIVETFGADTVRIYEMFMGPFDQAIPWDTNGLVGCRRFLERVLNVSDKVKPGINNALDKVLHKTIKKVTEDIEGMKFNTAIAQMMIFIKEAGEAGEVSDENWKLFLQVLAPFAPHLAEEFWEKLGEKKSIHLDVWPNYDKELIVDEEIELIVQVNGKLRDKINIKADLEEEEVKNIVLKSEKVKSWTGGGEIKKVIFVKGRLVNIVV